MDRLIAADNVDQAHADVAPNDGTPGYATNGDALAGTPATEWPAYQYNALQEEIIAVLVAAGITPDRTNNAQLTAAIKELVQLETGNYATFTDCKT